MFLIGISARELASTISTLQTLEPPPGISFGHDIPPLEALIYKLKRTSDNEIVYRLFDDGGEFHEEYFALAKGKFSVLETVIPDVEAYNKATGIKVPIHIYESKRQGPTLSGLETMRNLIEELFPHLSVNKTNEEA